MKKSRNFKNQGFDVTYHNPVFTELEVKGLITQKELNPAWVKASEKKKKKLRKWNYLEPVEETRKVTFCQTGIILGNTILNTVGISVMNPGDTNGELGKTIAEGRALKSDVTEVVLSSVKKLPKQVLAEQLKWASHYVARNLDDYVNNIRETLK